MLSLPLSAPNTGRPLPPASEVSFATGCLPRAIMISSPASARAISLERLVFASWIVTVAMAANPFASPFPQPQFLFGQGIEKEFVRNIELAREAARRTLSLARGDGLKP